MKWREIRIVTTNEASDAVTELLNSLGAGGVAIEDPYDIRKEIEKADSLDYADDNFLDSLGEEVVVKAYFSEETELEALISEIEARLGEMSAWLPTGKGYEGFKEVDDEDWANAWKKYYKPLHISDRLVVKPSWEEYDKDEDEIIIELDPGMAFGTGTHETTMMCSGLLEKYISKGDSVLDAGCGSGILSIMAAKLGAERVLAFDIDEVAVRVSRENINKNNVSDRVEVYKGVIEDAPREGFNIVVANIIANVIVSISGLVPEHLKPGGFFIASGIIKDRKQDVVDTYINIGLELIETVETGEWVALVFLKGRES